MSVPMTASIKENKLHIISKVALLLVVIGFLMPVCFGQTGFGIAYKLTKIGVDNFLNSFQNYASSYDSSAGDLSSLLYDSEEEAELDDLDEDDLYANDLYVDDLDDDYEDEYEDDLSSMDGNQKENITGIIMFSFFILTLLCGLLIIPILLNKKVHIGFDVASLIVTLICLEILAFSLRRLSDDFGSSVAFKNLGVGFYFILIGLVVSLVAHILCVKHLIKNNIIMFIMLALIMMIFAPLTGGNNWSPRNFTNIFFQYSYVLILAAGMVMVIIVQGIDLSVGSVCAFVGALSAMIYNTGAGTFVTLIAALLMGAGVGAYQGAWVAYGRMPSFIVTLSGMQLFRGLTYIVTKVNPIGLKDIGYSLLATGTMDEIMKLKKIGPYYPMSLIVAVIVLVIFVFSEFTSRNKKIKNEFEVSSLPVFITKIVLISILTLGLADRFARYRGLPIVALILGITIFIFHFILNNTVLGRYIYAVGGNPRSAKLSGINSELVTFIVFVFMGVMTGLAAVVSTGYMNSALPQAGNLFELDAIAACYIGGVSAGGGIGSVIGVIVGGLVMSSINNGMFLMNLGTHYQYVVRALILLLAVFYDVYSRRKAGLG